MSWDIFIQDLPPVATVADIPEDFRPRTIGKRDVIVARLREAVPFMEHQEDAWYVVSTEAAELSISVSNEPGTDDVTSIIVHVHGGEQAAACVAALVKASGHRALDTGTSEFFDPDAAEHGYEHWAAYRDHVLGTR